MGDFGSVVSVFVVVGEVIGGIGCVMVVCGVV